MSTCGECEHGARIKEDLTMRVCHGGPPQLIAVPAPGGMSIVGMLPHVHATDRACALFKRFEFQTLKAANTEGTDG